MRISQTLLNNYVQQKTRRAQERMVAASTRLSASSAVQTPSDDPVAAARLDRLNKGQSRLEALDRNRRIVKNDLQASDSLLEGIHESVVRAQELALQMGNDSRSAADRASAGKEVEMIFQQVLGLANRQQSGGKYLFGGLRDDVPALDASGQYQGNDSNRVVEVAPGIRIESTLSGRDVFGPNMEVLDVLDDLATSLAADDAPAIRATLDRLEEGRQIVSLARTDVGTRLARLEDLDDLSSQLMTSLKFEQGDLEAIDFAAGASEYATAQTAMQAVIETSRTMLQYGAGSWLR